MKNKHSQAPNPQFTRYSVAQRAKNTQVPNSQVPKSPSSESFTLIELMVVVSITVILSGMVFVNMRVGGRSTDVNSATEKMAGIVKQAQMQALTGKTVGGTRPNGGYGVYFDESTDPDSYKFFINDSVSANYEYDAGDTVIQTYTLLSQIDFMSISHTTILFVPPSGKIYVSNGAGGSELTGANISMVSIEHNDESFIGYVRINSQGEIDVRKNP